MVNAECAKLKAERERDELAEKLAKATGALDHIARLGCNYSEPCEELGMDGVCPPCIAQRLMDQIAPTTDDSDPGDTWEYLWSFDLDAYRKHDGPCLVALWVRSSFTGKTDWHVHLADIDDRGNLCDPDSGDDLGWRPEDVTAWKPCDITPPGIAPQAEVEPDSGQEVKP